MLKKLFIFLLLFFGILNTQVVVHNHTQNSLFVIFDSGYKYGFQISRNCSSIPSLIVFNTKEGVLLKNLMIIKPNEICDMNIYLTFDTRCPNISSHVWQVDVSLVKYNNNLVRMDIYDLNKTPRFTE